MYYIIIWTVCYLFSSLLVDTHTLDIEESDKCRPGYIGKYCRARCIYPYFGKECEAECNCSEPMCDVATGCGAVDRGMTPYVYDETVCFILLFLIHSQPILFQHSYFWKHKQILVNLGYKDNSSKYHIVCIYAPIYNTVIYLPCLKMAQQDIIGLTVEKLRSHNTFY